MTFAKKEKGFSLVELVIVIVIIGIIAAIAVPRISQSSQGASAAALRGNLAVLRAAIDLYAAEHNGVFPGDDGDKDTFVDQLTKKTDIDGNVDDGSDATGTVFIYGPYLRKGLPNIPVGTNKNANSVSLVTSATLTPDDSTAWLYSNDTGDIIANTADAAKDSSGNQFNEY